MDFANQSNNDQCTNACKLPTCGDGFKNGNETDVDCGGACPKCGLNLGCGGGADCGTGFCSAGKCAVGGTCKAIKQSDPNAANGTYPLDPDGVGPVVQFNAYCDMTTDGGGWTLALKADGNKDTFLYDAALWTNATLYQPNFPDLDRNEAKLQSFVSIAFTEVLIGFEYPIGAMGPVVLKTQKLARAAASLLAVFQAPYAATAVGRNAWKTLINTSSLQPNCNVEGFNVLPVDLNWSRTRIGIVSNQEANCGSPDSYIGIGGAGAPCGGPQRSSGNIAFCGPDNGDKSIPALGVVFVR